MTAANESRPSVSIGSEIHKRVKIRVAELGNITIKDAADQAFELWLTQSSRPAKSQKISQK